MNMKTNQTIELIMDTVNQLDLPTINVLNHLNNQEPVIYLCGVSSSGKTTFLNALYNMERDELFTSTDVSTKTEFRFQFDEVERILIEGDKSISIPSDIQKRKEIFKSLNEGEKSPKIYLNRDILKKRTIVDIPGVFDLSKNTNFTDQMLDEADTIIFFTPCTAKITGLEHNLLKKIDQIGIPIIVLFTMGDSTDVDEGITRKTLPFLVKERLNDCFANIKIAHHQIISSNDYYRMREGHGIDLFIDHIRTNDIDYKNMAQDNKIKNVTFHYTTLLKEKLENLKNDQLRFNRSVEQQNELWYNSEKRMLEQEKRNSIYAMESQLNWMLESAEMEIFGEMKEKIFTQTKLPPEKLKENFQINWAKSWEALKENNDYLSIKVPALPILKDDVFSVVKIDMDKIKTLLMKKEDDKAESKEDDKTDETKSAEKPKIKKWGEMNWLEKIELGIELGVNVGNIGIIHSKYKFLQDLKKIVSSGKAEIMRQIEEYYHSKDDLLENQKKVRIETQIQQNPITSLIDRHSEFLSKLQSPHVS